MSPSPVSGTALPQRVVILGGGPAAIAAAYWLSAPEQQGRYQITLYTQGWRLGGKCASGRNAALGDRIEEHGLHMLMGCYQNAFATMRSLYTAWRKVKVDPANPLQKWTDAFLPQRQITLMQQDGPGSPPSWSPWNFILPQLPGEPGDGPLTPDGQVTPPDPDAQQLLLSMVNWLLDNIPTGFPDAYELKIILNILKDILDNPFITNVIEALEAWRASNDTSAFFESDTLPTTSPSPDDNRFRILANLGIAVAFGYLRDIFFEGESGYDKLNTQDFRAWLKSCGASSETLASALVQAFYDLAFASIDGSSFPEAESIAAGVTLRTQMEMVLGYRNAPLWKMAAGMGDVVFTPFYDVLLARGVDIQFFSRTTALRPTTDGTAIGEVDIMIQAVTTTGMPYQPLRRVANLDCWPNQPDWSQLANGAALQAHGVNFESSYCSVSVGPLKTLVAGTDFDKVIVGLPPEALRPVAGALVTTNAKWLTALQESRSVSTQSLQLWMLPTLNDLGWPLGSTVLTSFIKPYDSWGDMTQVLAHETWSGPAVPQSIAYFCGCLQVMMGPVTPPMMQGSATAMASNWLNDNIRTLWPALGPNPTSDPCLFSRYSVANFDLSDVYVQTPAGLNVASRFDPAQPAGFANLYVVGDWTKTRYSGGCFESAIESAMLASRGISGYPQAIKTS